MKLLKYPLFYCAAGVAAAVLFSDIRHNFWLGLIVLGALISLYGWMTKGPCNEERYEIGDNCYFIGFVYTLAVISLSVALDAHELLGKNASGDGPQRLLQTVGIALGTSVVGMLWRFGLTHGIKIPQAQFDKLVNDTALATTRLAAAVEKLEAATGRIGHSAAAVDVSLHKVDDAMSEYATNMRSETGRIGKHLTEVAGKLFDDFGNRIADTLHKTQFDEVREELHSAVEHHRQAVSDTGALLQKSAAVLDAAAESAAAAAQKVDGALDAVHHSTAGQLQNTVDAIKQTLDALKDAMDGDQWRAVAAAADNFTAQTAKMEGGLQRVAAQQRTLVEDAGDDIVRLREIRATFDLLVKDLRSDSETIIKIKEEYRREFERAAQAALKETNLLYAKLARGAEMAVSAIENPGALSADLQKISRHLEDISARLKSSDK